MPSAVRVVVTNENAVPPELWGSRKKSCKGWLAELQGLIQAGTGKTLKIGPLEEKQAVNRRSQIGMKAKQHGIKVEFASLDGYLYVRVVGAGKSIAAAGALDDEGGNPSLSSLIVEVIQGSRWWTLERIANVVLSMDRPVARKANQTGIAHLLDALVNAGEIYSRDEQGVATYRATRGRSK